MTRTDTALAEWSSKCYFGGFNDTLAPVKLANLKVLDYVAPPPVGSQLIVEDNSVKVGRVLQTASQVAGHIGYGYWKFIARCYLLGMSGNIGALYAHHQVQYAA